MSREVTGAARKRNNQYQPKMKIKHIIACVATLAILTGVTASLFAEEEEDSGKQAKLMAKAKITKAEALEKAQAKVPNGTVKEAELENENGKLIWSFCFTTPDTKDITEVNVNAITGKVVSMEWETPSDEDTEKDGEAKEKKKEKDDDKD
jgi:uncharacterized membrane protein YkoI